MEYSHPIDRLGYKLRPVVLALLYLCGPVMLFTYCRLILIAIDQWPWWATAVTVISHLVGWLGIGALFDRQEERRMMPEADQDEPHLRS